MANYQNNLDRYSRMSRKTPETEPLRVTFDSFVGLAAILLFGLLGLLFFLNIIGGSYTDMNEIALAWALAFLSLAIVIVGIRMRRRSSFYSKTHALFLQTGTVQMRFVAATARVTMEDAEKMVRSMIQSKYYNTPSTRHLEISKDHKAITVSQPVQESNEVK